MTGAEFSFLACGPRIQGRNAGLAGAIIFFGISTDFITGTSSKIRRSLFVLCNFLIGHTRRVPGVLPDPRRVKFKGQNWGISYNRNPFKQILINLGGRSSRVV